MTTKSEQPSPPTPSLRVAVCPASSDDDAQRATASHLAKELDLPLADSPDETEIDAMLVVTALRLELRMIGGDPLTRGGKPLYADLGKLDVSTAMGKRVRQPIGKAIGLHDAKDARPTVIDCTAGWGEDSWLLAGLGCRVLATERHAIVCALLRDGFARAAIDCPEVASRITLVHASAIDLLQHWATDAAATSWLQRHNESVPADVDMLLRPEVVFLDPMFPPRRKGAEGKPMKVLRQLVGGDADADQLLKLARQVARRRVVVKRPLHGDPIGSESPATSHKGKSVRYDIYPTA